MRLFLPVEERPLAPPAVCAPAHVHRVGYLPVGASVDSWRSTSERLVSPISQFDKEKSVQLQVSPIQLDGINGLAAKATGMAKTSVAGVDASGVPPRGRPV
jgi:hypothetical protein